MPEGRFNSFSEFYQNSDYAKFPLEFRSQGSLPTTFIRAKQEAHSFTNAAVPEVVFHLSLNSDMDFRYDAGDGWKSAGRLQTGCLGISPADTEIRYQCESYHDLLMVAVPADGIDDLFDEFQYNCSDSFNPVYGNVFRDDTIRAALLRMWADSAKPDRASSLMVDGLQQTVLAQLLRRTNKPMTACAHKLSDKALAAIDEYIDEQEFLGLTIKELAAVAGVTEFQFARDFKKTTGTTPHQYVVEQRILKARELLSDPKLSLVDVAYACGFSSQSHMTDVFRDKLGITPGRYRAQIVS
ncbi:helix-turn-helix domain-containing protein [Roseobacter weihaiensis]|uniref:helix-turn-helix domain-containing protein n=1 Tax=Roseobacter weihaiensis TaxID=2763262 RepID=UPI001D0A50F9|nr:AraC family transcriptional regulator [Roseobacter sp. H9]